MKYLATILFFVSIYAQAGVSDKISVSTKLVSKDDSFFYFKNKKGVNYKIGVSYFKEKTKSLSKKIGKTVRIDISWEKRAEIVKQISLNNVTIPKRGTGGGVGFDD